MKNKFAKRIKELRLEMGAYQSEIALKLNIDTSTYGKYEQGRSEPSYDILIQIAKLYKVSVDYLLGLEN